MRRRAVPGSELITKVNVTPIIDVALVLVIILLVTAPLLSVADVPVDLPQAATREAEAQRTLSLTLGVHGERAIDEQRISANALAAALRARLEEPGNADVLVIVRADSGAPYSSVRDLLERARAAGARRLAIATRQKTRAER